MTYETANQIFEIVFFFVAVVILIALVVKG
jgi:hypothetical protein